MHKIQRLDAHLTNMIAAGEVVERPMGVVKELVENSIDAGAKTIDIHVRQGGLEEIQVCDDGCGMSAADASMAFERHATSKIHDIQDLWNISTMGFRGEALPSIASVSKVVLKTNDGSGGTQIEMAYGKVVKAGPAPANRGTNIIVKNLFQKTPARLKHMKTVPYEFSLISDVIQKFALSRSDIAFSLTHDDREVFSSSGRGNMLEVIMAIYGRDCAKQAIAVQAADDDYHIDGFAMQPSQTRASKYYMLFYINGRMIRSFRLQKAIMDAYKPYLPSDRYPMCVLNLTMDPKLVDVNVHPSKWEVRLSKEKQLEDLLKKALSEALENKLQVSRIVHKEKAKVEEQRFSFTYESTKKEDVVKPIMQKIREEFASYSSSEPKQELTFAPLAEEISTKQAIIVEAKESIQSESSVASHEDISFVQKSESAKNPSFPQMRVIGQLHGCYVLCEGEAGMYIVDQHAAQERYHYEEIQKQVLSGVKETQLLMVPLTIESSMSAVAQIDEINSLLEQIGIHLEAFGNHTFIVRELPVWMSDVEETLFLQDMIDLYMKNKEISLADLRKHAIATMACHSSIRFNRHLTHVEMEQVIDDLRHCEQPFHCPHGRPTFIELTLKELEKDFLRVK